MGIWRWLALNGDASRQSKADVLRELQSEMGEELDALLPSHKGMISLRELQSAGGEELRPFFGRTLIASALDRAFKGEV